LKSPSRLLIVLASGSDVAQKPAVLAFRYAATAAALDLSVELHVVGESIKLLQSSLASSHGDFLKKIREMKAMGVLLFACSAAIAEAGFTVADLVPEVDGVRGAAAILAAGMADDTRLLSF
jgi:predicted peroxiredoxin